MIASRNSAGSSPFASDEGERLGEVLDQVHDPEVDRQLEARAGTWLVGEPEHAAGDRVEDLVRPFGAGGEDEQSARLGLGLGAEDGAVHEALVAVGESRGVVGADGGHLDPEGLRIELRHRGLAGRAVHQHRDERLGAVDRLGRRVRDRGAGPSAFSRVRFQTVTSCPAAARFRAIGPPMIPVPKKAIFTGGTYKLSA